MSDLSKRIFKGTAADPDGPVLPCPVCKKPILATAKKCPECGMKVLRAGT